MHSTATWELLAVGSRLRSANSLKYGALSSATGFIEPALATYIEKVLGGERWVHEIKFDGYRVQVHVAHEAVKIFTLGNDWTNRLSKIADDAWHITAGSAIIDGEVVVPAESGTTAWVARFWKTLQIV